MSWVTFLLERPFGGSRGGKLQPNTQIFRDPEKRGWWLMGAPWIHVQHSHSTHESTLRWALFGKKKLSLAPLKGFDIAERIEEKQPRWLFVKFRFYGICELGAVFPG